MLAAAIIPAAPASAKNSYNESCSANPSALVAISNGMRAVKLCTNKILQFLF